jgi:circadian clock protein KaiB
MKPCTNLETGAGRVTTDLRLYVAGTDRRSTVVISNLLNFCQSHREWNYTLDIVDIVRHPEAATRDDILAIPTLVCVGSGCPKIIVGTLSNAQQVLRILEADMMAQQREPGTSFVQGIGTA